MVDGVECERCDAVYMNVTRHCKSMYGVSKKGIYVRQRRSKILNIQWRWGEKVVTD